MFRGNHCHCPVQDLQTWGLFIVHPKEQTSPQLPSVVFWSQLKIGVGPTRVECVTAHLERQRPVVLRQLAGLVPSPWPPWARVTGLLFLPTSLEP